MLRVLKILLLPAALAGGLSLSACGGNTQPEQTQIFDPQTTNLPGAMAQPSSGALFSFGGKSSGGSGQGTGIQVNAYLWRASLDVLSFMPLVSADPFGGVIITDWYTPPATPGERFKANAYILSQTMSANAVQVSIFHQVLQNGQWVDAEVDPATASGLEDRILARAADLKAEAQNTR
jgi:hypothetical protein